MVLLLICVDDIVITGMDSALISQIQQHLHNSFHMKYLGFLTYFLGREVHSGPIEIYLHQHKYMIELISLVGLQGSTSVDTLMEVNAKFRKDEGGLLPDPTLYRQLVESLNNLTITQTRYILCCPASLSVYAISASSSFDCCLSYYWVPFEDSEQGPILFS